LFLGPIGDRLIYHLATGHQDTDFVQSFLDQSYSQICPCRWRGCQSHAGRFGTELEIVQNLAWQAAGCRPAHTKDQAKDKHRCDQRPYKL
jgi:hypothetical protein